MSKEFKALPKRKSPIEIVESMGEAGHAYILCRAKNRNSGEVEIVIARGISSYCSPDSCTNYMYDSLGSSYFDEEFYLIDSKGRKIIDFVEGEIILELPA